jgi:uracil-DNA glycosylase
MTLVIGQYAMAWHLQDRKQRNLTETVKNWSAYGPEIFPLPHPSPRNNIWLKKNPWFNHDLLPDLRKGVRSTLA